MADRSTQLTTHDLFRLDDACSLIRQAFNEPPYLVGSAGIGGNFSFRDVDVRLILNDDAFDGWFNGHPRLWELLSLAIGDYLRRATDLPVDFQIQRQSEANKRHPGPRNPLGMDRVFAGGGDGTPPLIPHG